MPTIPFIKAHANGNDFLIVEESAIAAVAPRRHAAVARQLCARNTSIGADGIEFLDRRANGELFLRLFNADGSEAELSGNGTRCVAAWLAQSEACNEVVLGTHGGVRTCRVISSAGSSFEIESSMGIPRVMRRTIDLPAVGPVEGAMVNVGNPHFVLFVDPGSAPEDFSAHGLTWQALGAQIAVSPLFPHGTNVEFVRILSPSHIAFRIFERGCGPTTSSGTGTCASATAAIALGSCDRTLTASSEGGSQAVVWPANDQSMLLTGPAEIICTGEVSIA